jgi:hypothetical protein
MNEGYDISDNTVNENPGYYDQDVPEPLDHWSLEDFGDILAGGRKLS